MVNKSNGFTTLLLSAIVYVLGIVFDRIADQLADGRDKKNRAIFFEKDKESYSKIRNELYDKSDAVKQLFDYTRSRLRICRAWFFTRVHKTVIKKNRLALNRHKTS